MGAFWIALAMVFLAELGDKTQLVALCFATRFRAGVVMAGIFAATLVVHVFSVVLGQSADHLLSQSWINLIAGLAFVGFGLWTLRGDDLDDDTCRNRRGRSPFWIVASTFFLAELGDKTMLSTVALATKYPPIPVWIGSTLGMVVSDGLAILVGRLMGASLPERAVKTGAAVIFFIFGVYSGLQGARELPPYAWGIAVAAIAVMLGISLRGQTARPEQEEPVDEPVLSRK